MVHGGVTASSGDTERFTGQTLLVLGGVSLISPSLEGDPQGHTTAQSRVVGEAQNFGEKLPSNPDIATKHTAGGGKSPRNNEDPSTKGYG